MKFKSKAWIGFLVAATIGWPVLTPNYRPSQVILAAVFAYIASFLVIMYFAIKALKYFKII